MGFSDTDDLVPAQTLELTKEDLVAGSASVLKFVKFQRVTGLSVSERGLLFSRFRIVKGCGHVSMPAKHIYGFLSLAQPKPENIDPSPPLRFECCRVASDCGSGRGRGRT